MTKTLRSAQLKTGRLGAGASVGLAEGAAVIALGSGGRGGSSSQLLKSTEGFPGHIDSLDRLRENPSTCEDNTAHSLLPRCASALRQLGTANQVAFKSLLTLLRGTAERTLKVMHSAAIVLLRLLQ